MKEIISRIQNLNPKLNKYDTNINSSLSFLI